MFATLIYFALASGPAESSVRQAQARTLLRQCRAQKIYRVVAEPDIRLEFPAPIDPNDDENVSTDEFKRRNECVRRGAARLKLLINVRVNATF